MKHFLSGKIFCRKRNLNKKYVLGHVIGWNLNSQEYSGLEFILSEKYQGVKYFAGNVF